MSSTKKTGGGTDMRRIAEPRDPDDAIEWKRYTSERPTLGSMPKAELEGWALRLSSAVMSPWDKRWFIFFKSFICYFQSQDPGARCSGCYYIPGMQVERIRDGIPNHPSAPIHINSKKENCVVFHIQVPRKPGGDYRDLILSLPDEAVLTKWETHVAGIISRKSTGLNRFSGTSLGTSGSSDRGSLQQQVVTSPPTLSAHIPQRYLGILHSSGITSEEAKNNYSDVMSVIQFTEKNHPMAVNNNKNDILEELLSQNTSSTPKEKYALSELVSPEPALLIHSNLVKLDSGSQGEVYRATRKSDGADVALKKIFVKNEEKMLPALENEISMMYTSSHRNIVNFYSAHRDSESLWIAMELMAGGNLTDLLELPSARTFTEPQIAYICKNILAGLAYLHGKGRIHRDVKSDNILLNTRGEIKLGDFGFCASLSEGENDKRKSVVGSPYWMAPEVIRGEPYDSKADVWSMGIIVLELCDGQPPLMELSPMRALYVIVTQDAPLPKGPDSWSPELLHFISLMLNKDPNERVPASELLKHPFLQTVCFIF